MFLLLLFLRPDASLSRFPLLLQMLGTNLLLNTFIPDGIVSFTRGPGLASPPSPRMGSVAYMRVSFVLSLGALNMTSSLYSHDL